MRSIFADSYYYLALLNPRDAAHAPAMAATEGRSERLVTTAYVLLEVADAWAAPLDRRRFLALADRLAADRSVTVVPTRAELFERGLALYRRRLDKAWPLTDCISFVVMGDLGIEEALTGDIHFKQAGFRPLLAVEARRP
ncbi:MAG: PIN domain-containing protein [Planctomycetota bacterium]|nr:PIN domain-containing protein [Planctomycetota bacterium]